MDHRIPLCTRPGLWRNPMGCVTANRRNRPSSFWQREGRTGKKSALAWAQGQAHIIQYDKREGTTHININTYWPCNGPAFQKRRLEGKEILFGVSKDVTESGLAQSDIPIPIQRVAGQILPGKLGHG